MQNAKCKRGRAEQLAEWTGAVWAIIDGGWNKAEAVGSANYSLTCIFCAEIVGRCILGSAKCSFPTYYRPIGAWIERPHPSVPVLISFPRKRGCCFSEEMYHVLWIKMPLQKEKLFGKSLKRICSGVRMCVWKCVQYCPPNSFQF